MGFFGALWAEPSNNNYRNQNQNKIPYKQIKILITPTFKVLTHN